MANCYEREIQTFFSYDIDKSLQKRMLTGHCAEWLNDTISYIHSIINIPIDSFIEYIPNIKRQPIYSYDVFQFSNFDNATRNLCSKIVCSENAGLKFSEIGAMLLDDGSSRKYEAIRKYGENHIKMAEALGLAFKDGKNYYLSPLGCAFSELSDTETEKLLIRLILRNKLVCQLLSAAFKGPFSAEAFLYDLSYSTYQRRRSNIKYVMDLLNSSQEYQFAPITQNIQLY